MKRSKRQIAVLMLVVVCEMLMLAFGWIRISTNNEPFTMEVENIKELLNGYLEYPYLQQEIKMNLQKDSKYSFSEVQNNINSLSKAIGDNCLSPIELVFSTQVVFPFYEISLYDSYSTVTMVKALRFGCVGIIVFRVLFFFTIVLNVLKIYFHRKQCNRFMLISSIFNFLWIIFFYVGIALLNIFLQKIYGSGCFVQLTIPALISLLMLIVEIILHFRFKIAE